jgi:hypothetical protein
VTDSLLNNKPRSFQELLAGMTPEIHQSLKTAVELGRWPNGERLSKEQVELCLQAVIAWDQAHLPEPERVAYIDRSKLKTSHCDEE